MVIIEEENEAKICPRGLKEVQAIFKGFLEGLLVSKHVIPRRQVEEGHESETRNFSTILGIIGISMGIYIEGGFWILNQDLLFHPFLQDARCILVGCIRPFRFG
jgi:hypothetical protein